MNDEQIEHFRRHLLNWRGELVDEAPAPSRIWKTKPPTSPILPIAPLRKRNSAEFARETASEMIKKIDSTLDRLQNDDYGYCDACGIEIGIQRLEARPTATMCIDCKTLAETGAAELG